MKPWFPQSPFLQELVCFVQHTRNETTESLEEILLVRLKEKEYPYLLVDFILHEGMARRKNTKLQKCQ